MRHVLTSFLAFYWALVFALLAFMCIGGSRGVASALGVLGIAVEDSHFADLQHGAIVAPLAIALLVVAVLFCWALVETLLNVTTSPDTSDGVVRIAFISASGMLSLILIGGAAQGIKGLFMVVAVQLAALLASYVAMLAERRAAFATAVAADSEIRAAAHVMARGAAHGSLLSRISSRSNTNLEDGR